MSPRQLRDERVELTEALSQVEAEFKAACVVKESLSEGEKYEALERMERMLAAMNAW